jgi:hypothetical protein
MSISPNTGQHSLKRERKSFPYRERIVRKVLVSLKKRVFTSVRPCNVSLAGQAWDASVPPLQENAVKAVNQEAEDELE